MWNALYSFTDADRAEIRRVVDYAVKSEHVWLAIDPRKPGPHPLPPGDRREHCALCPDIGLRCVFTITDFSTVIPGDGLFRHLSISSGLDPFKLPAPHLIAEVYPLFGFTKPWRETYIGAAEHTKLAAVWFIEPYTPAS